MNDVSITEIDLLGPIRVAAISVQPGYNARMLVTNKHRLGLVFCLWIIVLIVLSGCTRLSARLTAEWKVSDVKLFDPLDAAVESYEITVISARARSGKLEIRLELLDVPEQPDADIWILVSSAANRVSWSDDILEHPDLGYADASRGCLIKFSSDGNHRAWDAAGRPVDQAQLKTLRQPILDFVDLSLRIPCGGISPDSMAFAVALVPVVAKTVSDQAGPVNLSSPPPGKAQVLLAFWNTFPAASPASALRAWDGAHGGYFGERHGLTRFLASAKAYPTPLFLLDFKTPESLSALDFMGGLELINQLARSGQLTLPDAALPSLAGSTGPEIDERMLADSRQAGESFGLRPSQIAYLASPAGNFPTLDSHKVILQNDFRAANSASGRILVTRTAATTRIYLPDPPLDQITRDGLSLQTRRQLLECINEIDSTESTILLLGGNFQDSAWSNEQAARAALEYLSVRPWIDWLTESDLLALRAMTRIRDSEPSPAAPTQVEVPAETFPDHPAWFAYRANQLPLGYPYEVAAPLHQTNQWLPDSLAQVPDVAVALTHSNECILLESDPDRTLCFLTSPEVFAVIDPFNAGLFYLGVATTDPSNPAFAGYAQIVGSSSQLALGFSDLSTWNLEAGVSADPAALPGGFTPDPSNVSFHLDETGLLTSGSIDLHYTLLADGIRVEGRAPQGDTYRTAIPLVVQPERRFTPGWAAEFFVEPIHSGFTLGWSGASRVTVISDAALDIQSFTDSIPFISNPEDPDYEYPSGHFLPFPLVRLNLSAQSDFYVEIRYRDFSLSQHP